MADVVSSIDGCRVGSASEDSLVGSGSETDSAVDVVIVAVTAGSGTEEVIAVKVIDLSLVGVTDALEDCGAVVDGLARVVEEVEDVSEIVEEVEEVEEVIQGREEIAGGTS